MFDVSICEKLLYKINRNRHSLELRRKKLLRKIISHTIVNHLNLSWNQGKVSDMVKIGLINANNIIVNRF